MAAAPLAAAKERQTDDDELLAWLAEGLTPGRIATRLGISRARVYKRIKDARRRAALRKETER